jgi:hypothetical protein
LVPDVVLCSSLAMHFLHHLKFELRALIHVGN